MCIISISVSLVIKYLLIKGKKYAYKKGNVCSPSVKTVFFTSILCANYDVGGPGWLTSSSCIVSESSKKNSLSWEIG